MQAANNRSIFLSTMPASRRDRRAAWAVVVVSSLLFACAAPFAGAANARSGVRCELSIGARDRMILSPRSCSFCSSACCARGRCCCSRADICSLQWQRSSTLLTFPGVFAPTGLFGAGPQTTAWLYMVWHGGFPLVVLGYALLKGKDGGAKIRGSVGAAILGSVIAVGVTMSVVAWVGIARHDILPIIVSGGHFNSALVGVVSVVWFLSLAAPCSCCGFGDRIQ